jgi:hypothetical protein
MSPWYFKNFWWWLRHWSAVRVFTTSDIFKKTFCDFLATLEDIYSLFARRNVRYSDCSSLVHFPFPYSSPIFWTLCFLEFCNIIGCIGCLNPVNGESPIVMGLNENRNGLLSWSWFSESIINLIFITI